MLNATQRNAIERAQQLLDEVGPRQVGSRLVVDQERVKVNEDPDGNFLWIPVYAEDDRLERWRYVMPVFWVGVHVRKETGVRLMLSPCRKGDLDTW